MENEAKELLDPALPWCWSWRHLSAVQRRQPEMLTGHLYELARRHERERKFPDWRHRPGPDVGLSDWLPWEELSPEEQWWISSTLNPSPPPALFLLREDQDQLPESLRQSIDDIENYQLLGRLWVRRKATDNALASGLVQEVRQQIPAPVLSPGEEALKKRKTPRPSRPRQPGTKTNDPSWRGVEVMDIQFYRLRQLTTAEKKLLGRARQAAAASYERLWLSTQV